jgi:hypothetical protein
LNKEIKEKGFDMLSGAKTDYAFDSIEKFIKELGIEPSREEKLKMILKW